MEKIFEISIKIHDYNIIDFLLANFLQFLNNRFALILLKKLMLLNKFLYFLQFIKVKNLMIANLISVMESDYGNYLIKLVVENWDIIDYEGFIPSVLANIFSLSKGKFSSSSLEKLLDVFPNEVFLFKFVFFLISNQEEFKSKLTI